MTAATAVQMAFSGLQMMSENAAISKRISARSRQRDREVAELNRQQKRENEVAREKKSDRAREYDIQLGTLRASSADGGVTKAALARAGGAAGFIAGLDKARIESNRQEIASQKRSQQVALIEETAAANSADQTRKRQNTLSFFGNAAGTYFQRAYSSTPTLAPVYDRSVALNRSGSTPGDRMGY